MVASIMMARKPDSAHDRYFVGIPSKFGLETMCTQLTVSLFFMNVKMRKQSIDKIYQIEYNNNTLTDRNLKKIRPNKKKEMKTTP